MKFIETLKLQSKLFFLLVLITLGLLSVGVLGAININNMKKNLDSLYFGSLVPVTELNEIVQIYYGSLGTVVYKAKASRISPQQVNVELQSGLKKINKLWHSYESHYKRDDEQQYIEYASIEIESANNYFKKILNHSITGKDLSTLSTNYLETHLSHINKVLQKLIKYEVNVAQYERKNLLETYNQTIQQVGIILFLIIMAILFISYSVFKSIQIEHTKLEEAGKKLRKANKKLENVSYTDSLTGLHNRRYFNLIYNRELKRAKRIHGYITFMMLDIDFFKQYNDTYGHIEGDFALKSVAKVLKDTLKRPGDFVFRLGGEEFGVLLCDTDESSSARIAQNICEAVKGRGLKHEKSSVSDFVTISIGVVCCVADDALNEETLLTRADDMLYKAKGSGRDGYKITTSITTATVVENGTDDKSA